MNIIAMNEALSTKPQVTDTPLFLWLEQKTRQFLDKPMLQEEVLEKVVAQATSDENLIGVLLFGSLASGTHSWKSDIDLIFVYQTCQPTSGVANIIVDGVVVQYFFTSYATLVENLEKVPYLLHMFCDAKVLFDRSGTFTPLVNQIESYFAAHPEVQEEWIRLEELHQIEKKGPECAQTTILQRWDEMEKKYSDGERKRTFFRGLPEERALTNKLEAEVK
jgi:predicted nucleotidyltransferase